MHVLYIVHDQRDCDMKLSSINYVYFYGAIIEGIERWSLDLIALGSNPGRYR